MGDLYKVLSELCEERKITAYRMCKDVGMQPSVMTDLKMGRRSSVKAETANRLATYFGVSVGYLLGQEESGSAVLDEDNNIVTIDDETRDIIDSLRTRPEMKVLFSVSKKATKEDILQAVKIIKALKDGE